MGGEKKGRGVSFVFRGPHKGHIFEGDFSGDLYGGIGSYKWPGEDVKIDPWACPFVIPYCFDLPGPTVATITSSSNTISRIRVSFVCTDLP